MSIRGLVSDNLNENLQLPRTQTHDAHVLLAEKQQIPGRWTLHGRRRIHETLDTSIGCAAAEVPQMGNEIANL